MLPTVQRLRDNREFRLVYARGRSFAHPVAVIYTMRRVGEYAVIVSGLRVGFVVSKKQGKAVVRNRIKRRLREALRRQLKILDNGPIDVVIVARNKAIHATTTEITQALDELLRRGGLLNASGPHLVTGNSNGANERPMPQ